MADIYYKVTDSMAKSQGENNELRYGVITFTSGNVFGQQMRGQAPGNNPPSHNWSTALTNLYQHCNLI